MPPPPHMVTDHSTGALPLTEISASRPRLTGTAPSDGPCLFDLNTKLTALLHENFAAAHSALHRSTLIQPPHQSNAETPDLDILPDLPTWLLGVLAGFAGFVLVIACLLFLVQFPAPPVLRRRWMRRIRSSVRGWIRGLCKRRWSGYGRVVEDDYELGMLHDDDRDWMDEAKGRLKQRRGRVQSLSVETRGECMGLGIAVPGEMHGNLDAGEEGQREVDGRFDGLTSLTTARAAYLSPSSRPSRRSSPRTQHSASPLFSSAGAISGGLGSNSAFHQRRNATTPRGSKDSSPPCEDVNQYKDPNDYVRRAVLPKPSLLQSVSQGIERVASKLSVILDSEVDTRKNTAVGLLLPVRENERAKALVLGEFVD